MVSTSSHHDFPAVNCLPRSHSPRAYTLVVGRTRDNETIVHLVTSNTSLIVTGLAAELILFLARARRGSDGLPKWSSVGDVLHHLSLHLPGRLDRKRLRALTRRLNRLMQRTDISDLVHTHRSRGVRLAAYPASIVRTLERTGQSTEERRKTNE